MGKYDVPVAAPLAMFAVIIPIARTDESGQRFEERVTLTFPSADLESARKVGDDIAWVVVSNLPKGDDNNARGWKLAGSTTVVPAATS